MENKIPTLFEKGKTSTFLLVISNKKLLRCHFTCFTDSYWDQNPPIFPDVFNLHNYYFTRLDYRFLCQPASYQLLQ